MAKEKRKPSWLRRLAFAGLGLLGVLTVAAGGVWWTSNSKLTRVYAFDCEECEVPTDDASIARGKHLVETIMGCPECHGSDYSGKVVVDDPALGLLAGPNITGARGSATEGYTPRDWVAAIRHGIDRKGQPLVLMPSEDYGKFSNRDMGRVIAYMQSLKPVEKPSTPITLRPLGHFLIAIGEIKLAVEKCDHTARHDAEITPGPTAEYGEMLAGVCMGCHGPQYSGGAIPGVPPEWPKARNLTPHATGLKDWSEADFVRSMREGRRKNGEPINEVMPWKYYRAMKDEELSALWKFFKALPPKEAGGR